MAMSRQSCLAVPALLVPPLLVLLLVGTPAFVHGTHSLEAEGYADWVGGFHAPGMNGDVLAMDSFGGQRIAAGRFTVAGGVDCSHIARWDGNSWQPLADGLNGDVMALTLWEGDLIAGGRFTFSGDVPLRHVARWDGASWQPLGEGVDGEVLALSVFRNALVAGGLFRRAGGTDAGGVARWDGRDWSPLGKGVASGGSVQAMIEFESELVVAGRFDVIDGNPAHSIASWNGRSWNGLGEGVDRDIHTLAVYARELVAGGAFTRAGESDTRALVTWDGARWHGLGNGPPGSFPITHALTVYDGDLVAAGSFGDPSLGAANPVVRWNGRAWQSVGIGVGGGLVFALASDSCGLDAGGSFADADGEVVNGICRFEARRWHLLSNGSGFDAPIRALEVFEKRVVAAGSFTRAGPTHVRSIASWNGHHWEPLGTGLEGTVLQLAQFQGALISAGRFSLDASGPEENVARWTGSRWESLGAGLNGSVLDLAVYGDELWAVGRFNASGSVPMEHIAAWDGQTWRGLPLDLEVPIGRPEMNTLAVYDGALIVGGRFDRLNGLPIANLAARRDGIWYGLGDGVDEVVEDLAVHQGKLYAAGFFNYAGSLFAPQVAAWDSTTLQWSPAGTGLRFDDFFVPDAVLRLHSFGADLVLGGRFDGIDDVRAQNVARWDGTRWWPLRSGVNAPVVAFTHDGTSLFLGGDFDRAGGMASSFIAVWDRDLPAPVQHFEARVEEGRVLLQWELSATALERTHRVRLLREPPTASGLELPGSPLRASDFMRFVDAAPAPDTRYRYRVILVQHDGTEIDGEELQVDTGALNRTHLAAPLVDASGNLEVHYSIGRDGEAEIRLFDVRGRLVKTLVRGPHAPGEYVTTWNRQLASGVRSPRGVYFLHLQAGSIAATRKLILLDD